MFPKTFNTIEDLGKYLIHELNYNENDGFSFAGIKIGTDFNEIQKQLGEPASLLIESEQQQTMRYLAHIDHPQHGIRDHHQLSLLFWGFHRAPFVFIHLHFNYFSTGASAQPMKDFTDTLLKQIIEKFGKPEKKSFRLVKENVEYKINNHKLLIWRNVEGIRLQMSDSSQTLKV